MPFSRVEPRIISSLKENGIIRFLLYRKVREPSSEKLRRMRGILLELSLPSDNFFAL